jgi:hypothetical protein
VTIPSVEIFVRGERRRNMERTEKDMKREIKIRKKCADFLISLVNVRIIRIAFEEEREKFVVY